MRGARLRLAGLAAAGCAALVAVAGQGCAATAPGTAPAAARTDREPAPAFALISSRPVPSGTVLRAEELEPLAERTARWQGAAGDDGVEIRTWAGEDGVHRTDPRGERTMVRAADGSVALRWQRDAGDGTGTAFDPPLLLAPAELRDGECATGRSSVRTMRAGVPEHDDGSALREVRLASLDRVRTPLGEFDAIRVDAVLTMKVPFASMRRETSTWVRAGAGPVAVRSDERILVMGVFPRNSSELRVLLPQGGTP